MTDASYVSLARGRRIWARKAGQGPPLVLISGAGAPGMDHAPLVEPELRTFATVITYDRAGLGRSDPGPRRATVADMSEDLEELLEVLVPEEPVTLVGHSLGGLIALYFAASFPERVNGLVVIDSAFDPELIPASMARAVRLIQVVSYVPGIRKFLLRRAAAAQLGSTISLEGRSALQAVMFADTRILRWNARELSTLPDSFQLTRARIQERGLPHVPFVVITAAHHRSAHSKEDPHERVIAAQQRLAELGGGRLITADGSGHLITFERPEIVIAAVREVLEAVESR